jgi:RNA polymerase sigma-70 factor (ECF subfamily)
VTTWIHRITVNSATRLLERRAKSATEVLDEARDVIEHRPERDPERAASAADDRGRLVEALAELPATLRVVVVLRDVYDLPHREIARELGISQTAAKVRLHRARRLLRERALPVVPGRRQIVPVGAGSGGGAGAGAGAGDGHTEAEPVLGEAAS